MADVSTQYRRIIAELEARPIMPDRMPSLEPTIEGLRRIGIEKFPFFADAPRDRNRVVVVAGTNGKGSVCATLEALLSAAGERVGLYTSPHLIDTTERFRLAGADLTETQFIQSYQSVIGRTGDLFLTHFELLTLIAVWAFCAGEVAPPVDRMILEVGLGGTFDATNAVPHGACVITSLGLDHTKILGNSLESIARNKFGIVPRRSEDLSQGALVVHSPFQPELTPLVQEVQSETESRWIEAVASKAGVEIRSGRPVWTISTEWGTAELVLAGARGASNTATALTMFRSLGYDPAKYLSALSKVRWPGRMELISGTPCALYLSGDHNPQGVGSLLELLPHYQRRHLHLVIGVGREKDLETMLESIAALPDTSLYLTETPFMTRSIDEYGKWRERAIGAWADPRRALDEARARAHAEDLIVITGSLYLVGALRAQLLATGDGDIRRAAGT